MPKLITYSSEECAYLRDGQGNEYREDSMELQDYLHTENDVEAGNTDDLHSEDKWRRRGVQVSWTKGQHVEIGVASFDPSREMPSEGVFMTLDRAACNDLINAIRRARDSAHGKDA